MFPRVSQEVEELPRVNIVAPEDGAQVPAGEVEIRVEVENGSLAMSPTDRGGHLHLYVDDELMQMPYSDTATVDLGAGQHELRVEYVDERHISYTPPVQDVANVVAE